MQFAGADIIERFDGAAIQHLETHEMEMNRMNVVSEIHQVPNLSGVDDGFLGNRLMPISGVKQHQDGLTVRAIVFVERKRAGANCIGLWNAGYRTQSSWKNAGVVDFAAGDAELHQLDGGIFENDMSAFVIAKVDYKIGALGGVNN